MAESSDLSQFLTTKTSPSSQNITTDGNLTNGNGTGKDVPEPSLISGLVLMMGFGVWSARKKVNWYVVFKSEIIVGC
ncbi:PEP-CTERM sorting domain-containing protein [Okeania sp. KiyG1]|uniref:PEP-CTERM sorting domain-containing protein n=1 Tax=Okeania sp. KiyG1 TaxID=2720165 RepID=UPI0019225D59|nr:PEP-CTERM sorting domain-containing protein [Okeania sp. KiyG1]GFZ96826.1 hypothetical protein CYANOKiyG1_07950 [Okeania sp. KiyG1]